MREKETIFTEDIESVLGKSAQQIEKDAVEVTAEVVEESGVQSTTEVTYIVDSLKGEDNEKRE